MKGRQTDARLRYENIATIIKYVNRTLNTLTWEHMRLPWWRKEGPWRAQRPLSSRPSWYRHTRSGCSAAGHLLQSWACCRHLMRGKRRSVEYDQAVDVKTRSYRLPVVLKVRENIVHESRNERNGLLLLITAVDHIQKRSQDLCRHETCQKCHIHPQDYDILSSTFKTLPQPEVSEPVHCKLMVLKRKP